MKVILLIGPFSPPITGVSFANDTLFEEATKRNISIDSINFSYSSLKENIGDFSLSKVMYYVRLYFFLYKVLFADKIYMTTGQTFFGVLKYAPFILLSKILNKEVVIHVHGNYLGRQYDELVGVKRRIFHYLVSRFDKGIVLSESLRGNLNPFIKEENIYEIYNFVEKNILDTVFLKDIIIKQSTELRLVYLSNLMQEKGILDFLNALILLKQEEINFSASIAGAIDPVTKSKVNDLLINLGESVNYLGVVRGDDKRDLLLNSNVFVFPTYYEMEGQPISILEAMATGNVILTTNHAGIPDIFKDKVNGFYVEKKSANDIFDKIKMIKENDIKKIIVCNFNEAKDKYSVSKFVNNVLSVLDAKIK